ncbi:MAG: hypothetical protein R3C03_05490 [Pirellulaceae bacterium]
MLQRLDEIGLRGLQVERAIELWEQSSSAEQKQQISDYLVQLVIEHASSMQAEDAWPDLERVRAITASAAQAESIRLRLALIHGAYRSEFFDPIIVWRNANSSERSGKIVTEAEGLFDELTLLREQLERQAVEENTSEWSRSELEQMLFEEALLRCLIASRLCLLNTETSREWAAEAERAARQLFGSRELATLDDVIGQATSSGWVRQVVLAWCLAESTMRGDSVVVRSLNEFHNQLPSEFDRREIRRWQWAVRLASIRAQTQKELVLPDAMLQWPSAERIEYCDAVVETLNGGIANRLGQQWLMSAAIKRMIVEGARIRGLEPEDVEGLNEYLIGVEQWYQVAQANHLHRTSRDRADLLPAIASLKELEQMNWRNAYSVNEQVSLDLLAANIYWDMRDLESALRFADSIIKAVGDAVEVDAILDDAILDEAVLNEARLLRSRCLVGLAATDPAIKSQAAAAVDEGLAISTDPEARLDLELSRLRLLDDELSLNDQLSRINQLRLVYGQHWQIDLAILRTLMQTISSANDPQESGNALNDFESTLARLLSDRSVPSLARMNGWVYWQSMINSIPPNSSQSNEVLRYRELRAVRMSLPKESPVVSESLRQEFRYAVRKCDLRRG